MKTAKTSLAALLAFTFTFNAYAKDPAAPADPATLKAQASVAKGLDYLKTQQQPDGSWEKLGEPPAVTALAL